MQIFRKLRNYAVNGVESNSVWCTCAEHEGARARLHTNTQAKNRKKERKGEEVGRERGAQLVSILLFSLCTPVERAASATESRLRLYTRRAAAPERRPALLTARPPPPKISLACYNMAVSLPSRRGRLFVCRPPSYHGKNFATTAATGFRCERTYAEREKERERANVARSQWCVKKGQRPTLTSTRTVQCAARRAAAAAPSFSSCTTYTVCALSLSLTVHTYMYIYALAGLFWFPGRYPGVVVPLLPSPRCRCCSLYYTPSFSNSRRASSATTPKAHSRSSSSIYSR